MSDLATIDSYPTGTSDYGSIAVSGKGADFVAVADRYDGRIRVFPEGSSTPQYDEYIDAGVYHNGLAFDPSGDRLFAVMEEAGAHFLVIDDPTLDTATVTLDGPSAVEVTSPIELSGTLSFTGGDPPTGKEVRTRHQGPARTRLRSPGRRPLPRTDHGPSRSDRCVGRRRQ